jgi:hypothetical protein
MIRRAFPLGVGLACIASLLSCGSSGSSSSSTDHAGVYSATYSGTYSVTSPAGTPGGSNTASGTITISDLTGGAVAATFQIPPNPVSGAIDFAPSGSTWIATAPATGGMCFVGQVGTDTQTNCCTQCSISFAGDTFTQPNAGTFTGTTAQGVTYSGTYSGTWVGTRQ